MIEKASSHSIQLFNSGYKCAESVLISVAQAHHIDSPIIPQIATGFCSGTARTGNICGAVAGAIIAIGLLRGRSSHQQPVEPTYELVQQFIESFEAQFGSTTCLGLTGVHLGTEEGQAAFEAAGMMEKCTQYVGQATRLVMQLVGDDG